MEANKKNFAEGIGDGDENTSVQNFNMGIRKSSLLLPSDFIGIDE